MSSAMTAPPPKGPTSSVKSPRAHALQTRKGRGIAKPVGDFVGKLTKKAFEKYGFSAASLLTDWPLIAGPTLAQYTMPERLKWPHHVDAYSDTPVGAEGRPGATLVLRVDSARAIDVQYQSAQLIERINAYFGYKAVTALRFIQAPLSPTPELNAPAQEPDLSAPAQAYGAPLSETGATGSDMSPSSGAALASPRRPPRPRPRPHSRTRPNTPPSTPAKAPDDAEIQKNLDAALERLEQSIQAEMAAKHRQRNEI